MWEKNAKYCEATFGIYIDWDERFYHCPECGEPIYECDWTTYELENELCPVCGFNKDDEELDELFD